MKKQLTLLALLAVLAGSNVNAFSREERLQYAAFTTVAAGETYLEYKQNMGAINRLAATNTQQLYFTPARRGAETALGVIRHLWRAVNGFILVYQEWNLKGGGKKGLAAIIALQAIKLGHQFMTRRTFKLNEHDRLLFASYNAHHLSPEEQEALTRLQTELRTTAKIITTAETAFNTPAIILAVEIALFNKESLLPLEKNPTTWLLYAFASATTHLYHSIKLRNRMYRYINSILDKARALHEKGELQLITDDSANETDDKTTNQPTLTAH